MCIHTYIYIDTHTHIYLNNDPVTLRRAKISIIRPQLPAYGFAVVSKRIILRGNNVGGRAS